MNLRKATLLIIAATYICLCAIFYISSSLILIKGLNSLESNYAKNNVERVRFALNQKISALNKTLHDWSSWDYLYNYAIGKNTDFPESNFMDYTYTSLGINMIIVYDRNGNIKAGKAFDLINKKEVPIDPKVIQQIKQISKVMRSQDTAWNISGIVMVSGRPMLFAARPILTSSDQGPSAGSFIMGDNMDDIDIKELSQITQLSLEIFNIADTGIPADVRDAVSKLDKSSSIYTHEISEGFIAGYTTVSDIFGKPSLILRVKMPRGAYAQAKKSIFYFILSLMVIGIITALIIILLLERKLLSRLETIVKGLVRIRETGNLKQRIFVAGNDELSNLSKTINTMMNSLEVSEKQLEESEEKYRTLVELANDGIIITQNMELKYINPRISEISGYKPEDVLGKSFTDFVNPDDVPKVMNEYTKELRISDTGGIFETSFIHKTGKLIPIEASARIISYNGMPGGLIIIRDITERKKAQELIASEKERLSVTLRSIGDGVIATDTSMNIVIMNKAAEKLTGWRQEEASGRPLSEVFPIIREKTRERCDQPLMKIMSKGIIVELVNQTILVAKNGIERAIAVTGAPIRAAGGESIGIILVFRDITERRRIDEELSKIQRLDTAGILASGIAHDFNNILTCIIGNLALAKDQSAENCRLLECIDEAETASLRAKELAQQLLTFSRGVTPKKTRTSVREIIRDSAEFILRGSNIRCIYELPADLWMIDADPGQISQVVYNIVLNARQAMPEGGIVEIKAENVILGEEHNLPLAYGSYVKITIKDTGIGIPEEIISKIFDPFFTTKESGSGLGLASVKSIVTKHLGMVMASSTSGAGTIFTIYFPSAKIHSVNQPAIEGDDSLSLGHVLIISENDSEKSAVDDILTMLGYVTFKASSAEDAALWLKDARKNGTPCDVVVVNVSDRSEKFSDTLKSFRNSMPGIRSVAIINDSESGAAMKSLSEAGFDDFIVKPLRVQNVNETVQRVMLDIS